MFFLGINRSFAKKGNHKDNKFFNNKKQNFNLLEGFYD